MGCGTSRTTVQHLTRQMSELSQDLIKENILQPAEKHSSTLSPSININKGNTSIDNMEVSSDPVKRIGSNESGFDRKISYGTTDNVKGKGNLVNSQGDAVKGQGNDAKGRGDAVKGQGNDTKGQGDEGKGEGDEVKGKGDGVEGEGQEVKVKEIKILTREEWEMKAKEKLAMLKERLIALINEDPVYDEDKIPVKPFREGILAIGKLYYVMRGADRKDVQRYVQEFSQTYIETNVFPAVLCPFIINTLPESRYKNAEGKLVTTVLNPMKNVLSNLLNCTDALPALSEIVCKVPDFLYSLRVKLEDLKAGHFEREGEANYEDRLLKTILGIIHNLAMNEVCMPDIRNHNFTPVLLAYVDSRLAMCRLSAIAGLADIVDEKESGLLQANKSGIKFLIKIFGNSLKKDAHKESGWNSQELARTVGRLARNDTNKKMLVEEGALPLLVNLAKSLDVAEVKESMEALWVLAFDEDNKQKILEEADLLEVVIEKYKSSNDKAVRKPCQGILWNLRDLLTASDKYRDIGKEFSGHSPKHSKKAAGKLAGHLMISYQWGHQKQLIEVKQQLKQNGFDIWMDIDNMGGSTLQAMAEAIEDASIVLICMSQRYKDSPNCRAEAEYAFSQRKVIVPLMMDTGYRPDGWLGMILGSKLFFDFSGKYKFETKMEGLRRELDKRTADAVSEISEDMVEGKVQKPLSSERSPATYRTPPSNQTSLEDVKKWTSEDVKKWLVKHNLTNDSLAKLTGREVAFLRNLRFEAPECFYRIVETKLDVSDLLGLVNFTEAMDDLGN